MDITVYLPDELGREAKAAELNLSRLLRDAVTDELHRRKEMAETLSDVGTVELFLEDSENRPYTARIRATLLADENEHDIYVYLTEKENVIVYEADKVRYTEIEDPETQLRDWLNPGPYSEAMHGLGIKPTIDLDI